MKLPLPLLRKNLQAHKNEFGHVLILAGSPSMLGASALCGLGAMRTGVGLATIGVPRSLNLTLQRKISPVMMTLPLKETKEQTLALTAYAQIAPHFKDYSVIAIGPGLSRHPGTQKFILKMIASSPIPLIIDADALNALAKHISVLQQTKTIKILTPHPGEMARLMGISQIQIANDRQKIASQFARQNHCILVLKGHRTVVAAPDGRTYINKTGNVGMATAGSGDVLTGMISALLAQGVSGFEAAQWGVYLHGKAGDLAQRIKTKPALLATDIIEHIPSALRELLHKRH